MPDNKINERLLRIKAIDELFASKPGETFMPEEIIAYVNSKNYNWCYNRHKFARDIKFLQNEKNAQLKEERCLPQKGVGRMITKYGYENWDASIFHDSLSHDDKLLIRDMLGVMQLKGIETLKTFVKFELNYGKDVSKAYSPIISFTKNPLEKKILSKHLNKLLTCIRQQKVIHIKMQDRFDSAKITKHIVHPWYLREYNRRWYLFGKEDRSIRHYAIDRILSISERKKTYEAADRSIEEILENVIGINFKEDDRAEDIIFWVSNDSSDFVLKKPIHKSMEQIEESEVRQYDCQDSLDKLPNKQGVFLKMKCIINYELRREMMSFGTALVVLAPNKLRLEIKRKLQDMCNNYN